MKVRSLIAATSSFTKRGATTVNCWSYRFKFLHPAVQKHRSREKNSNFNVKDYKRSYDTKMHILFDQEEET